MRPTRWMRVYRTRMDEGWENCRNCVTARATTFGHLQPRSRGGEFSSTNITLLCAACNRQQEDEIWPWLTPLQSEEDFVDIVGYRLARQIDPIHKLKLCRYAPGHAPTDRMTYRLKERFNSSP